MTRRNYSALALKGGYSFWNGGNTRAEAIRLTIERCSDYR
jgi:hypothetical protein